MSTFYKKPDLEYSELDQKDQTELDYNKVTEILDRTNHDNTYADLMEKEKTVLSAVNSIVKTYKDNELGDSEFVNMRLSFIAQRFFIVMQDIIQDITDRKIDLDTFTKEDRLFYVGIFMILVAHLH